MAAHSAGQPAMARAMVLRQHAEPVLVSPEVVMTAHEELFVELDSAAIEPQIDSISQNPSVPSLTLFASARFISGFH